MTAIGKDDRQLGLPKPFSRQDMGISLIFTHGWVLAPYGVALLLE